MRLDKRSVRALCKLTQLTLAQPPRRGYHLWKAFQTNIPNLHGGSDGREGYLPPRSASSASGKHSVSGEGDQ